MEEKIVLHIEFGSSDSIDLSRAVINGVSPLQLLAVAEYLKVVATAQLENAYRAMQTPQVTVPRQEILRP